MSVRPTGNKPFHASLRSLPDPNVRTFLPQRVVSASAPPIVIGSYTLQLFPALITGASSSTRASSSSSTSTSSSSSAPKLKLPSLAGRAAPVTAVSSSSLSSSVAMPLDSSSSSSSTSSTGARRVLTSSQLQINKEITDLYEELTRPNEILKKHLLFERLLSEEDVGSGSLKETAELLPKIIDKLANQRIVEAYTPFEPSIHEGISTSSRSLTHFYRTCLARFHKLNGKISILESRTGQVRVVIL